MPGHNPSEKVMVLLIPNMIDGQLLRQHRVSCRKDMIYYLVRYPSSTGVDVVAGSGSARGHDLLWHSRVTKI